MDIVKHIKQHTENLQTVCDRLTAAQLKDLKPVVMGFYYQLPGFEAVIKKYIKISITKDQLTADIVKGNLESYQTAIEKTNAELDEYADDYEEPEALDIFILEALDNAVADTSAANLVSLFTGVINTLDYYENFSDEPGYWNNLLEQELAFQLEILSTMESNKPLSASIYQERYANVDFTAL